MASATRESEQLRLATQQETTELRTGAQREAEQQRAAVDREVQEAKRLLAVERERLAREATEHHTSAIAETKKLVEDAEARATAAEQRARDALTQAKEAQDQAAKESEASLSRARREPPDSIKPGVALRITQGALGVALDGSGLAALAFLGGLFVELATTDFRQHTCFFAGTLEAPQGGIEVFIFLDANAWHAVSLKTGRELWSPTRQAPVR